MENNFFFQFWVSRSLRDFHVVLSVVAVCSQVIGSASGNQNISSFGEIIALFTILHFFLHGYFYRQQKFLSDNMRVYSLPKKKIARIGSLFLLLFLTCICIGMAIVREIYSGTLLEKVKSLFLYLFQSLLGQAFQSDGLGKGELISQENTLLGAMNQISAKPDSAWDNLINQVQTILILLGILLLIVLCIFAVVSFVRRIAAKAHLQIKQVVRKDTVEQEKQLRRTASSKEKLLDFSPVAKIRRAYRRCINQRRRKNQSIPQWMSPKEVEQLVSVPEEMAYQQLHELYEKARYSQFGCSQEDVQTVKKLKI